MTADPLALAVEALIEARELIEHWGSYAGEYFQEKHDLPGDLARLDETIAALRAAPAPSAPVVSEEVVERVARAIHVEAVGSDPDELIHHPAQKSWETPRWPRWRQWEDAARAALAAMAGGGEGLGSARASRDARGKARPASQHSDGDADQ